MLTVETHLAGQVFPGKRQDIIEFMDSVGYWLLEIGRREEGKDDVFVKRGMELLGEMEKGGDEQKMENEEEMEKEARDNREEL